MIPSTLKKKGGGEGRGEGRGAGRGKGSRAWLAVGEREMGGGGGGRRGVSGMLCLCFNHSDGYCVHTLGITIILDLFGEEKAVDRDNTT